MVGKIILSLTFIGIICQGSYAKDASKTNNQIEKFNVEFDLNVNDTKIPYRIFAIILNYYIPWLSISRNKVSNSAGIELKAGVFFERGDFIPEDKRHGPLSYVKSQYLMLNIVGTAELIHGGPYVKNCQFSFTQIPPINNELPALVKEVFITEKLNEFLGEQLCKSINTTI